MTLNHDELTTEEMNNLLAELGESKFYPAMIKYMFERDKLVIDAIRANDPFKHPTEIARNQGITIGLFDLRDYIELLKTRRAEAEGAQADVE